MPLGPADRRTMPGALGRRTDRLLADLAACDPGRALALRRRVAAIAAALADREARIAFGGHFSSGKSSVLNVLLGRPLLPTGDFPETGVPCWIRRGPHDSAWVQTGHTLTPIAPDTESIARQVSLIGEAGDYRHQVAEVDRLLLDCAGDAVPPGVAWIDSPGINDTAEMTRRAARTVAMADLLVWVINSRQPLSEAEQEFLGEHIERAGAASVVFVVNVFLRRDTPELWQDYLTGRAGALRERITAAFDGAIAETVFVSASGAARHPDGFGGPELHRLVRSLGGPQDRRLRTARLWQASQGYRAVAGLADKMCRLERERVARATAALVRFRQEQAEREHRFRQELPRAVARACQAARRQAEECGTAVAGEMAAGPLRRDGSYGSSLARRLGDVAAAFAGRLAAEIDRCAQAHGHTPLPGEAKRRLSALTRLPAVTVAVPDGPLGGGRLITAADEALRKARHSARWTRFQQLRDRALDLGQDLASRTSAADLRVAQANALAAACTAAEALAAAEAPAVRIALEACRPAGREPAPPDERPATAAEALRDHLRALAVACLDEAARERPAADGEETR